MNLAIRRTAKSAVAIIASCDVMWKYSYGQWETKDNQGHDSGHSATESLIVS